MGNVAPVVPPGLWTTILKEEMGVFSASTLRKAMMDEMDLLFKFLEMLRGNVISKLDYRWV